jgi:hypothetical protein
VIDVRVGTAQPPDLRIRREAALHVLVHEHLQVDAGVAKGTDDDVGADAGLDRHIAARIGDAAIDRIVRARFPDLRLRAGDHPRQRRRLRDGGRGEEYD